MRTVLIALVSLLLLAWAQAQPAQAQPAQAQPAFSDVAQDHWAADAVSRMARQGLVLGFPDGAFHGEQRLSRYETALILDRLFTLLEDRTEALRALGGDAALLRARLAAVEATTSVLAARVRLLETGGTLGPDPLTARVDALEAEVARLRTELRALRGAPSAANDAAAAAGRPGEAGGRGPVGPAGPAGAPGASGAVADGAAGADAEDPAGPVADGARGAGPGDSDAVGAGIGAEAPGVAGDALAAARRPWRVALAAGFAPEGAPLRLALGHEDLLGFAGLRASVEVLLDGDGMGDVAVAGHLTRRFGSGRYHGYVGAGLGYRFDLGEAAPAWGPYLGAVLGAELGLTDRWGVFLEGTVDWHVAPPEDAPEVPWSPVRPSLMLGASYRF